MARTQTGKQLLEKHGNTVVPLAEICEEYLGLSEIQAKRQAKNRMIGKKPQLEIPAFRLGNSQKLPWLVKVSDLAKIIDEKYEESASVGA